MTDRLERTVSDLRRKWVPDHRLGVFEVSVVEGGEGEGRKLVGATTSREALAAVQRLAAEAGLGVEVAALPAAAVRDEPGAVVTAAVFGFVLSWNDLLVSKVLYVGSTPMLAPAIVNLMDPINRIEPQLSMAGLIASLPVLTIALLMQRYLIRGLGEGAVK